jgi:hypothetical protein
MDFDDAIDFIEYNTVRACPYIGERAPIILRRLDQWHTPETSKT